MDFDEDQEEGAAMNGGAQDNWGGQNSWGAPNNQAPQGNEETQDNEGTQGSEGSNGSESTLETKPSISANALRAKRTGKFEKSHSRRSSPIVQKIRRHLG